MQQLDSNHKPNTIFRGINIVIKYVAKEFRTLDLW